MIEKIGLRAAEFVGSTARRVAGAAEQVIEDQRAPKHRLVKVVVPVVAAGAAAVAAAVAGAAGGSTTQNRSSGSSARKPSGNGSRSTGTARSNGSSSSAKSKVQGAAEKTREELYELAKKADVPGRSSMNKDELAKALTDR